MSTEVEAIELKGADNLDAIEYSREHIPSDRAIAPYTLTGFKRIVFLALYALIVSSSIGGMIYTFYVNPWFALMILPVCYLFNNLLFLVTHSRLHASFIELPESENERYLSPFVHPSLSEHLRVPRNMAGNANVLFHGCQSHL